VTDEITQQRRLLESLYLKTSDGTIRWDYDAADDSCEASIGNGYVQIMQETDDDGDYYTVIKIMNAKKETIDRITGGWGLGSMTPMYTGHSSYWELIQQLRVRAERAAKGADVVINSILGSLDADRLQFGEQNGDLLF
jgi:hypothetical protein